MNPAARLRALRLLCRLLSEGRTTIDDRTWRHVAAVAVEHRLAPALWLASASANLPGDVRDGLHRAFNRNLGRSLQLRAHLAEVLATLNRAGLTPVPLKGAYHLLEETFPHPAARVLMDIDLLVDDVAAAAAALTAAGYRPRPRPAFADAHELPMVSPRGIVVELHHRLGDGAVNAAVPTAIFLAEAQPVHRNGVAYVLPSPAMVVVHNVLHAQIQDRNLRVCGLPLRQLHTFVTFVRTRGDQVDWSTVTAALPDGARRRALAVHLDESEALFGLPKPMPSRAANWHRRACALNAALADRPADVARNLERAFAGEYLRARYGDAHRPVLWARHARTVWRERGHRALGVATESTAWR